MAAVGLPRPGDVPPRAPAGDGPDRAGADPADRRIARTVSRALRPSRRPGDRPPAAAILGADLDGDRAEPHAGRPPAGAEAPGLPRRSPRCSGRHTAPAPHRAPRPCPRHQTRPDPPRRPRHLEPPTPPAAEPGAARSVRAGHWPASVGFDGPADRGCARLTRPQLPSVVERTIRAPRRGHRRRPSAGRAQAGRDRSPEPADGFRRRSAGRCRRPSIDAPRRARPSSAARPPASRGSAPSGGSTPRDERLAHDVDHVQVPRAGSPGA